MALRDIVAQTVTGLGYDLVDVERSAGGLLRVTIDWPWSGEPVPEGQEPLITVEDCETVTRQLQYALEVEGVDYTRLEVSSPGIDRPLRGEQDLLRFQGWLVDITLKAPIGAAAQGRVAANRKKFRGVLEQVGAGADGNGAQWQLVWRDEPAPSKPGQRVSAKRLAQAPVHALGFVWSEVKEARLAPVVNFKGRAAAAPAPAPAGPGLDNAS